MNEKMNGKCAVIADASLEKYDNRVMLIVALNEEHYKRVEWKLTSMDAIQTLFDAAKAIKTEDLIGTPMIVYIDGHGVIADAEVNESLVWR